MMQRMAIVVVAAHVSAMIGPWIRYVGMLWLLAGLLVEAFLRLAVRDARFLWARYPPVTVATLLMVMSFLLVMPYLLVLDLVVGMQVPLEVFVTMVGLCGTGFVASAIEQFVHLGGGARGEETPQP